MARWASCKGPISFCTFVSSLGRRYFNTKAAMPCSLSFWAISCPSCHMARCIYPPPGTTMTAMPVAFSFGGRKIFSVGQLTRERLHLLLGSEVSLSGVGFEGGGAPAGGGGAGGGAGAGGGGGI